MPFKNIENQPRVPIIRTGLQRPLELAPPSQGEPHPPRRSRDVTLGRRRRLPKPNQPLGQDDDFSRFSRPLSGSRSSPNKSAEGWTQRRPSEDNIVERCLVGAAHRLDADERARRRPQPCRPDLSSPRTSMVHFPPQKYTLITILTFHRSFWSKSRAPSPPVSQPCSDCEASGVWRKVCTHRSKPRLPKIF